VTWIAVDTGGTFTDCVLLDAQGVELVKVLSTPDDPSRAVLAGIAELAERRGYSGSGWIDEVIHGTTVGTNAVLERKGARTALVLNQGFRDLLAIGRQDRPSLYALRVERPAPLVARDDCLEVAGRLDHRGHPIEPLEAASLAYLIDALCRQPAIEAVAICLLHAYANPTHEIAVARPSPSNGRRCRAHPRCCPSFASRARWPPS
jgi:N-methylhydantoinase A